MQLSDSPVELGESRLGKHQHVLDATGCGFVHQMLELIELEHDAAHDFVELLLFFALKHVSVSKNKSVRVLLGHLKRFQFVLALLQVHLDQALFLEVHLEFPLDRLDRPALLFHSQFDGMSIMESNLSLSFL